MPYCPKCRVEYRDGFYTCANCHISLVSELPKERKAEPEPVSIPKGFVEYAGEIVCISTYVYRQEAIAAKSLLTSNDIDSFVSADDAGGMEPSLSFVRGARLMVKEVDAKNAIELLDHAKLMNRDERDVKGDVPDNLDPLQAARKEGQIFGKGMKGHYWKNPFTRIGFGLLGLLFLTLGLGSIRTCFSVLIYARNDGGMLIGSIVSFVIGVAMSIVGFMMLRNGLRK